MDGAKAMSSGAQTIIHELLHVAVAMYGPAAVTPPTGRFQPAWTQVDNGPGIPDSAETNNNSIIYHACGVKQW
jgi:hypothetical protein